MCAGIQHQKVDIDDYIHEEDEIEDYFAEETEPSYSCDTCERDFYSEDEYNLHMSEHRVCNLEGCTFTAHEKIIEKHIRMQHSTGLYEKIKKVNSPEGIAAWIEERKKKYPSKENVEKRYERQEALLKKGVRLQKNSNKFGKDKFRLESTAKNQSRLSKTAPRKKKRKPRQPPKLSLIDEKSDWNGKMFPFKGTSDLFENQQTDKQISDFEDDEWKEHSSSNTVKVNKSLGSLMAAYGSDSEEEIAETNENTLKTNENPLKTNENATKTNENTTKTNENSSKINENLPDVEVNKAESDNEAPEEVKIVKVATETDITPTQEPKTNPINKSNKRKRPDKKNSNKRPKPNNYDNPIPSTSTGITRNNSHNYPHNHFRKRKVTLLEKLLESEIRQERNLLLQCVRFVVENNFFKEN